jgi:hypothetical protein
MSDRTKTGMLRETALYMKGTDDKVPLKGVRVDVTVKDVASHTTVTQVFQNTEHNALEAVYCFPIEEGAAVNGFEIETGGRRLLPPGPGSRGHPVHLHRQHQTGAGGENPRHLRGRASRL